MKRIITIILLNIFFMTSCNVSKTHPDIKTTSIQGYIEIKDNSLYVDEVEIITSEDKERIEELKLDEFEDMANGYFIYNEETIKVTYELTDDTTYTFVDTNFGVVEDNNGEMVYINTNKEEFIEHLNTTYTDIPPAQKVPFFIEVEDGKVINIQEKFEFTI